MARSMELLHKRPIEEVTIQRKRFRLVDLYTSRNQRNQNPPTMSHGDQQFQQSQLDLQRNICEVDVDNIGFGSFNNFPFMKVAWVVGWKVWRGDYRHFLERSH